MVAWDHSPVVAMRLRGRPSTESAGGERRMLPWEEQGYFKGGPGYAPKDKTGAIRWGKYSEPTTPITAVATVTSACSRTGPDPPVSLRPASTAPVYNPL